MVLLSIVKLFQVMFSVMVNMESREDLINWKCLNVVVEDVIQMAITVQIDWARWSGAEDQIDADVIAACMAS